MSISNRFNALPNFNFNPKTFSLQSEQWIINPRSDCIKIHKSTNCIRIQNPGRSPFVSTNWNIVETLLKHYKKVKTKVNVSTFSLFQLFKIVKTLVETLVETLTFEEFSSMFQLMFQQCFNNLLNELKHWLKH